LAAHAVSVEAAVAERGDKRRARVQDGEEGERGAGRGGNGEHFADEEKASGRRVAVGVGRLRVLEKGIRLLTHSGSMGYV
jgi:hypothetical protein